MFEILKEDVNQQTSFLGEATEPDLKTVDIAVDDSDSCNPYIDANDTEGTPFHGIGGMSDPEGDDIDDLDDIDDDGDVDEDDDEQILDLLGEEEDVLVAVLEGAALEGLPEDEEDEEEYDDIDLDENDEVEIEDYE